MDFKKNLVVLFLFAILLSSFVAAGSFYNFLELITGRVPGNDPNNQGDAPGGNATPPGLAGVPSPPRCGDGVCSTAEAHTDDASAVYCPEDCDYVEVPPSEPEPNDGMVGGPSCTDSDNGAVIEVKGQVTANGEVFTDACYSQYRVEEFVCVNGEIDSQVFPCLGGECREGACVKTDVIVPTVFPYVPATAVAQKVEFSSRAAPAYVTLVKSQPRALAGNVELAYKTLAGKNVVTVSKSFEVKDGSALVLGGRKYKVSLEGDVLVLEGVTPTKVRAPVTDVRSGKTQLTIDELPTSRVAARPTLLTRITATFKRGA